MNASGQKGLQSRQRKTKLALKESEQKVALIGPKGPAISVTSKVLATIEDKNIGIFFK